VDIIHHNNLRGRIEFLRKREVKNLAVIKTSSFQHVVRDPHIKTSA
jgi:hypothetical protein